MALQGPIDRLTHDTLRGAVLTLRETERRHNFPPTLHLGGPSHAVIHVEASGTPLDPGGRADLVLAMLQYASRVSSRPYAWLARPGVLSPHDVDVSWASALRWAAAAADTCVPFVVVTKHGWFDPESGVSREWRRLRRHGPAATR